MGWEQIFSQPGESAFNFFGTSVAISGNYAIVGAPRFDSDQIPDRGKAYFYLKKY